ncbi:MAG: ABC transporter ATP-binding protein [Prochlorotrichaceae cyanobacterium]|jgi:neutral amino acid transport system ATP-binding protein
MAPVLDDDRSPAPLLKVEQVYAGYQPGLSILQGISLEVAAGEIVAIVGPNGAGKSTLAKAIVGLVPLQQGEIYLQNQSLSALPPHEIIPLGVGYVPQINNVFPSLTVAENLEMGAFAAALSAPALRSLLRELYETFPTLAQRQQQRAGSLSGGERQILAMAKALILKPQLLVLDEPSAALSPRLVQTIFEQIQSINDRGTSILLVEQNARSALKLAHRGYVLDQGKDCFSGKGIELLENPQVANLYLGKGST